MGNIIIANLPLTKTTTEYLERMDVELENIPPNPLGPEKVHQILYEASFSQINILHLSSIEEIHQAGIGDENINKFEISERLSIASIWIGNRLKQSLKLIEESEKKMNESSIEQLIQAQKSLFKKEMQQCKTCFLITKANIISFIAMSICLITTLVANLITVKAESNFNSSWALIILSIIEAAVTIILIILRRKHQHEEKKSSIISKDKQKIKSSQEMAQIISKGDSYVIKFLSDARIKGLNRIGQQQIYYLYNFLPLIISPIQRGKVEYILLQREIQLIRERTVQLKDENKDINKNRQQLLDKLRNMESYKCWSCYLTSLEAIFCIFSCLQAVLATLICCWVVETPVAGKWSLSDVVLIIESILGGIFIIQIVRRSCPCCFKPQDHNHTK